MMRHRRSGSIIVRCARNSIVFGVTAITVAGSSFFTNYANAIDYNAVNTIYSENFDTLPTEPTNANLDNAGIPWIDDSTSSATQTSVPGWYLYHATMQAEGGTNDHQRLRIGPGGNTGAFWDFGIEGINPVTDRALGNLTSSTINTSHLALRLTNNTGVTLGQFTLNYTGEQWRDGGAATPIPHMMSFGYAVTAAPPTNISQLSTTSVAALNFTSPIFVNTSGVNLDGNDPANRTALSTTVGGFTWNPGEDLWLRWTDVDHPGADHGLAIDDLSFSADIPAEVNSVQNGLASAGTTWSDGEPGGIGKGYHVINGHVVTLDGPFLGSKLSVENGTVDINSGGSDQFFGQIIVEPGGNLTESVAGDVSIGSDATSGLRLNRDVAFNLDPNANFRIKAALTGTGALNLNESSPGNAADAQVYLDATNTHAGVIRFNAGKQVNVTGGAGLSTIEMNSTQAGGNILNLDPTVSTTVTRATFNAPGTIIHGVSNTALSVGIRLQSFGTLTVNAPITVDLSQTFAREERRLLISGFQGNGNILVKGTSTDPTDPNAGGTDPNFTGITRNEFEVGAQGTDPSGGSEPYSGTISTQDYVNVEIRRSLPAARFEVNQNGILETGGQDVPLPNNLGTTLGEVQVNAGGVLEVGFEQANAVGGAFAVGHHVNLLRLTNRNGRSGSLTLTGGATPSKLRMQVGANATTFAPEFDSIVASGNVTLDGNLEVFVNPVSCTGNDPCGANANADLSLNVGDTFDFISIDTSIRGDYDGNGSIGQEDYDTWRTTFGNGVAVGTGADGNGNGLVDAADYVVWRNGGAASPLGAISGSFDNIKAFDALGNEMPNVTFEVLLNGTNTLAQLRVAAISGAGSGGAVPEPGTLLILTPYLAYWAIRRRAR